MPGRLAIDFGTSNTVLAVWDPARQEGVPLHIPDYARRFAGRREQAQQAQQAGANDEVSLIPSLIHLTGDGPTWIGQQVVERRLVDQAGTFRWMKRYISHRSPVKLRVAGKQVSYFDAGRDFLTALLTFAAAEASVRDEEIAMTVPVEAYEHYENWLGSVAEAAGMPRFRLIDEPSAAALGYGANIQPGHVYVIFDFGGGTIDVSVVLIEEEAAARLGRRCRVLGKAGVDEGGMNIDQWIYQDVLRKAGKDPADDDVRQHSRALLSACERVKVDLSHADHAHHAAGPFDVALNRAGFEQLLDNHDLLTKIDHAIRKALNEARERGYTEDDVKRVLTIGGSSQAPVVQQTLRRIFGKQRVMLDRPMDAVARGAAAFVAGVDFYDHIQHEYAIRYLDRATGDYAYRTLVPRQTPYPTEKPVAKLTLKASHDGQTQLGLAVFEIGRGRAAGADNTAVELVFDPSGAARVVQLDPDELSKREHFWVNEHSPTFLVADPPGQQGEKRFEVEFGIDGNKRLHVTARDLIADRTILQQHPMVKLT